MALPVGFSKRARRQSRWALLAVGLPAGALLWQPTLADAQTGVKWFGKKPAAEARPEPPAHGFATTVRRMMDQARAQAAAGQYEAAVQTAQRARKIAEASSTVLGTGTDVSFAAADELCQQLITLRDAQGPTAAAAPAVAAVPQRPVTPAPVKSAPPKEVTVPPSKAQPTVVQALETVPAIAPRPNVAPEFPTNETLTLDELARMPLPPVRSANIPFQPAPVARTPVVEAPVSEPPTGTSVEGDPAKIASESPAPAPHEPVVKTPLTPAIEHVEARSAYPPIRPRRDLPTTRRTASLSAGAPLRTGVPLSAGTSVIDQREALSTSEARPVAESAAEEFPVAQSDVFLGTIEELPAEELLVELGDPAPISPLPEAPAGQVVAQIVATPSSLTDRPTAAPVKVILGRSRPLRGHTTRDIDQAVSVTEPVQGLVTANQPPEAVEPAPTRRVSTPAEMPADPAFLSPEPVQTTAAVRQGTPQLPQVKDGDWSGKGAGSRSHVTVDDGWSRPGQTGPLSTPTAVEAPAHVDPVSFEQVQPAVPMREAGGSALPQRVEGSPAISSPALEDLVHRPNVWLREAPSAGPVTPPPTAVSVSLDTWCRAQLQRTGLSWLTPTVALAGLGVLCITIGMFCVGWATRRS